MPRNQLKRAVGATRIAAAALVGLSTGAVGVHAQSWPAKQVRFVVPYPPGGGVDAIARAIAPKLAERLSQPVVIDNRGGAGGNIGTEIAARTAPDGYTLMMGAAALAINVSLYAKLPFDPLKDFTPVSLLAATPNIVTVHPSMPVKSMRDLIALARATPGGINYASAGNGTTSHLAAELLRSMAKVNLVHIPYKGTTGALTALVGGEAPLMLAPALTVLPQIQAGRLRALAITSARRSAVLPDLPTVAESGLPEFEASQWYGVLVPAGTPADIVDRLHREIVGVLKLPEVSQALARDGSIPIGSSPSEFAAYFKSEIDKWAKVVKASGARVD